LKVPLFHCQWIRLPNGVKTDKYGMTNVNFRFLSYREQPFILAKYVTQVFYIKDPDPAVTPHVSKPHNYVNHMFMRL
jgi:hypothetical protein